MTRWHNSNSYYICSYTILPSNPQFKTLKLTISASILSILLIATIIGTENRNKYMLNEPKKFFSLLLYILHLII